MAEDTARFRTAGGWFVELDLPLSDRDQARVDAGELTRVDADGKPVPARGTPSGPDETAEEQPKRRR